MKRIFNFFKWLFGYGTPDFKKTEELVKQESKQIAEMQKSVAEIKVIHEKVVSRLEFCNPETPKKDLVINPRMTSTQLRHYLINNGVLEVSEMSRKEKQFYAKKVYFLRYKRGMKISFDKSTKTYKYYKNGL
jgi:hypothetical protein